MIRNKMMRKAQERRRSEEEKLKGEKRLEDSG
jgi:hypothetical protein